MLVLGGCGGPAPEEAAPVISLAPVRTSGALADGFEIEPGSGLVGAVFPVDLREGWQAILRVDGDARRVFEGYVRQAKDLGHAMQSGWCCRPEGQWCSNPDDENTGDDPPGPFPVGCTAYTDAPDDLALSLYAFVGADGHGYVRIRIDRLSTEAEPLPHIPSGPVAPATDVEVAPDLTPETDDPPIRVVEGSALISEPLPVECVTGGYVAVLRVTGELTPVLRGYQEQFTSGGFGSGEGLSGNDDELRVVTSAAGGGSLYAVAVPGDPSHVLIERCND